MQTSKHLSLAWPIIFFVSFMAAYTQNVSSETQPQANKTITAEYDAGKTNARTVPFLSLRNVTGSDKATDFFGDRRSTLSAGFCELTHTPLNSLKSIAKKTSFYIPDEIVKLDAISLSPVEEFWSGMGQSLNQQSPLLYVHGFFISFERGCRRASLLQDSIDLSGRLVFFSWPSDGAIFNYTHDEADLYWSVDPLQGVLLDMIDRFGTGKANIVAHSLGTRGVMLALVRLVQAQEDDEPLLNQIVLIAPDIDAGIFKQYLPMIRPLVKNITVYVSSKDSPLALSRQVHGYPRLGESGAHLDGMTGIEIIDISDIPIRVPSGHVYHLYQSIVTEDLDQLINGNKPAAQRRNLERVSDNRWRLQQAVTE